jgi:hypothetical protein
MRLACTIVGMLCLSSVACGEEAPAGWTRVVAAGDGYIQLVHADREADVCVMITLGEPSEYDTPNPDLVVRGVDYVIGAGWGRPYRSSCSTDSLVDLYESDNVSGKIVFDDFINFADLDAPCTVSFDLRVVGDEGKSYEISASDFPILDVGCPRPGVYAAEYSDLDAAHGQYDGSDMLVVSAWDDAREVCVWARFSNDAKLPASTVEVAGAWVYAGLRFGLVEREACEASNFIIPPTNADYLSDSAPELGSTGAVAFAKTNAEGTPCVLDIDLDLRSLGRFDWTPDDVHMIADDVVVSGACD